MFIDFPVSLAMREVPTKRFTFKCTRHVKNCRPRQDPIVIMMTREVAGCRHLTIPRQRSTMIARDVLHNDLRTYLQDKRIGFPAEKVGSLGEEFLKNLSYAILPLSQNVWQSLNDKHNQGGQAPCSGFGIFFGRKVLGHKADRPCMTTMVKHLQELWIGMEKKLKKENWPEVSSKIKHLSDLIMKYANIITSQADRHIDLINNEQPARTLETASNVAVIEPLPLSATLSCHLLTLNMTIMDQEVYVRILMMYIGIILLCAMSIGTSPSLL